ncbi:hypothetical protein ABH920_009110 [Catenulispora sp. EB89]|uniref:hypothetical protein n=1 Tax=Catenulispora sp. EB89 TaxID=3156257 RepID=UPI0035169573
MAKLWQVASEDERPQWALVPHVSVGPLRFEMSPAEVAASIGAQRPTISRSNAHDGLVRESYPDPGLTLYYRPQDPKLFGISVNALRGPQVSFEGRALVGQVPSEVEQWLFERAEQRPAHSELFYLPAAECGSFSLGMVVCVQRAGDRLISRPVFLPADANDDMYHQLPSEAWQI